MKEGWIMMYEARRLYDVLGMGFFLGLNATKREQMRDSRVVLHWHRKKKKGCYLEITIIGDRERVL